MALQGEALIREARAATEKCRDLAGQLFHWATTPSIGTLPHTWSFLLCREAQASGLFCCLTFKISWPLSEDRWSIHQPARKCPPQHTC